MHFLYACADGLNHASNNKNLFTMEAGAHTRTYMHMHTHMHTCTHMCRLTCVCTHKKSMPTGTHTHTCTPILEHMPAHTVPFHVPGQCTPLARQLSLVRWGEWGIQKPHSQPVGTSRGQIKSLVFPAHVLWHCIQSTHVLVRKRIGKLGRSRVWVQAQPSDGHFSFTELLLTPLLGGEPPFHRKWSWGSHGEEVGGIRSGSPGPPAQNPPTLPTAWSSRLFPRKTLAWVRDISKISPAHPCPAPGHNSATRSLYDPGHLIRPLWESLTIHMTREFSWCFSKSVMSCD